MSRSNRILQSKDYLAKLLAMENLTVLHDGSAQTASFDPKKRVLTLPILKVMTNFMYDAFIGHEISHALYTDGKQIELFMAENPEIPFVLINIVEDARIEKLIKRKYPGLKSDFFRFYQLLSDPKNEFGLDFFSLENTDLSKLDIFDRLNLHFKVGSFKKIPFNPSEEWTLDLLENLETMDDVFGACKKLMEFHKKQQQQQSKSQPQSQSKTTQQSSSQTQTGASSEPIVVKQEDLKESDGDSEDTVEAEVLNPQDLPEQKNKKQKKEEQDSSGKQGGSGENKKPKPLGEHTQKIEKEMLKIIVDKGDNVHYSMFTDEISVEKNISKSKLTCTPEMFNMYTKFLGDINPTINLMVSQFNMKKSADEYKKMKLSNSGKLNTKKLATYRTSNGSNMFLQNEIYPETQDHGLILFVDWSSSMDNIIHNVMKQALVIIEFCRKVNIPVKIYAFTDGSCNTAFSNGLKYGVTSPRSNLNVKELYCSIRFKNKAQHSAQCSALYKFSSKPAEVTSIMYMSGTPLNSLALFSNSIVNKFCEETKKQKVSVVLLTDGGAGDTVPMVCGKTNILKHEKTGKLFQSEQNSHPWHFMFSLAKQSGRIKSLCGIYIDSSYESAKYAIIPENKPEQIKEFDSKKKSFFNEKYAIIEKTTYFDAYMVVNPICFNFGTQVSEFKKLSSMPTTVAVEEAFSKELNRTKSKLVFMKYFIDIIA